MGNSVFGECSVLGHGDHNAFGQRETSNPSDATGMMTCPVCWRCMGLSLRTCVGPLFGQSKCAPIRIAGTPMLLGACSTSIGRLCRGRILEFNVFRLGVGSWHWSVPFNICMAQTG